MGLFDSLAGRMLGGQGGEGLNELLGAVLSGKVDVASSLSGVLNSVGGVPGLQERFEQSGLGGHFASWVGTGENQGISAEQLSQALGGSADAVNQAKAMGIDLIAVLPMLSTLLPGLIDKLTPNGAINPETAQGAGLEQAIGELMKGGGLMDILGGGGGLGGLLGGFFGGGKS